MLSSKISRRALGALVLCAGAVPAAIAATPGGEPQRGGTLVIGATLTPRNLNGAVQSGWATGIPSAQLFASPLRFDDQWNPQPYLAESWKLSEDGRSLTLKLRKNAVFHDGRPVTSADVAFSIMAIKAHHPFQSMMAPVERVDTPDLHTAIVRMSAPHPAIVLAMSPALCPILPRHIYDDGHDLKTHPRNSANVVGSGPFRLVEFTPGQRVVMERFDRFFIPGRPYLDKLVLNLSPETQTLILGLERGEVHLVPFLTVTSDLRRLAGNPRLTLTSKGYEGVGPINWLAFNLTRKPLSDLRVRRAIAHAVDQHFVAKVLMGGFAKPAEGPIVASSPLATDDLVRYPLDLKKSAALLDEAGLKAGAAGERFRITLDYVPGADDQQKIVAEYIRAQLKKIGIGVDVRASGDFPTWAKRIGEKDFDMTMDVVFNWGDPVIGVHRTYLSTNIRPIVWTNTQSYSNPEVDKLLNTAGSLLDPTQRKAYYATFQKIVTQELPVEFINVVPYHTVASRRVGNLPTSIWGPMSPLDEVYLSR